MAGGHEVEVTVRPGQGEALRQLALVRHSDTDDAAAVTGDNSASEHAHAPEAMKVFCQICACYVMLDLPQAAQLSNFYCVGRSVVLHLLK